MGPILSVVIPTFDNEGTIGRCLDSILSEDSVPIEVICVDDGSQDGTCDVLDRYAGEDPRVRVLRHESNRSAHVSRRDGVLLSTGKYVWFVDGDDTISSGAIPELVSEMETDPVSVLHFSTTIVNEGNVPENRVKFMEQFVRPYKGKLLGDQVFKGCFSEGKYRFSLWNKIYDGDMCRKAFAEMADRSLPKAQDKYEYMVLALNATSYKGIGSNGCYQYHFGAGLTGTRLDTAGFRRYCDMFLVADESDGYVSGIGKGEQYRGVMSRYRRELVADCVNNWTNSVSDGDRGECFDMMVEAWGMVDVVAYLASQNWYSQGKIASFVKGSSLSVRRDVEVRRIATYYHSIANGGVQRVTAGLVNLWVGMGYEVLLITDGEPTENDYPIDSSVRRAVIPAANATTRDNYAARAKALKHVLDDFKPDVMVYHAWVTNLLLWDMTVCKLGGTAFVTHCHNNFSILARNARAYFAALPRIYRLCDSVVVLNEMDVRFWSCFNPNVHLVQNPLTFDAKHTKRVNLDNHNVIWLARLSQEKRPLDAVHIMARVVQAVPDAQLHIVGSGPESIEKEMRKLIKDLSLTDNVHMDGFTLDVYSQYSKASVFLMTSEYEGFPTTLAESQSLGMPCVMYDMPYLSMVKDNPGIVSVRQGDKNAAADAIVSLLTDPVAKERASIHAFKKVKDMASYDYEGAWKGIFSSLGDGSVSSDGISDLMWETLLDSYEAGASRNNAKVNDLEKKVKEKTSAEASAIAKVEVDRAVSEIKNTWTYRFGELITFLPKVLRGDIKL
ncbi:MAG: glycosyltransferase [Candidatus Methanomethylophilaceae archaeon]|nr:glycosyltransferase [Candidatus Methanomethylophilaceae archaeon]